MSREQYLAEARKQSVLDLITPSPHDQKPSPPAADETTKWRKLINASSDSHLTALWERYDADCQTRGISETYLAFVPKAHQLTHPDIPHYWDMYVHNCLERDEAPDPFLMFANRMQTALERENISSSGKSGGSLR